MEKKIGRRHEAHVRTQSVCAEHADVFDATPGGQKARAALGAHVAQVDGLLALQERSVEDRRSASAQCRLSRKTLRAAARAVVAVGRVVNIPTPLMGTMQLPIGAGDDALLAYSRGLLERISAHADAFVAEGLPPDLLKNLGDGITGFAAAREAQAASRQRFTAASESIRDALVGAEKTIDVLQAILINTPNAPPEVLTKLRIARRIGPRASRPPQQPPQSTPSDKAA